VSGAAAPASRELREVVVCDNAAALSRAAAERLEAAIDEAVARSGRCSVALSGGSTPRALYRLLADPTAPFRRHIPWTRVHLFWGDERHVPPDHRDSNYRMVRETLLRSISIPEENVHRVQAELAEAAQAARAYEAVLRSFFGAEPRFDVVLLGLGEDAHTASLFPGSEALDERERWVAAPFVAKQSAHRITLTPPVLDGARLALFLVSGAAKARALRDVLEGERDPQRFPAQVVAAERNLWLADRDAAAQLPSSPPDR
jgi:6-phosphogluconolactonase